MKRRSGKKVTLFALVLGLLLVVSAGFAYAGDLDAGLDPIFAAGLNGGNEVPPNESPASGSALVKIHPSGTALLFRLTVRDLTGTESAAHIHCGVPGENGPVGVTIPFSNPTPISGGTRYQGAMTAADSGNGCGWADIADAYAAIQAGEAYVNVHTSTFGGGEIRGQLGCVANCAGR